MEKLTYAEFYNRMLEHGKTHLNNEDWNDQITGVIVYKADNWKKPYTEEQRSYRVSSYNRRFQMGKFANSMYGDCLDGSDQGVRLDLYDWDIDYCYFEEES